MRSEPRSLRHGTAATELAVSLPVLMLLALSCADFGRVMHHYQIVSNAARTGTDAGAMRKFTPLTRAVWEEEVRLTVHEELGNLPDFDEDLLQYELTTSVDANDLTTVRVEITYPFRSAVAWPGIPHELQLRALSQVRQFR